MATKKATTLNCKRIIFLMDFEAWAWVVALEFGILALVMIYYLNYQIQ